MPSSQGSPDIALGHRVRDLRAKRQMSQTQLATTTGLSGSYVSLIESGRRTPGADVLQRIADALDCSVVYLHTCQKPGERAGQGRLAGAALADERNPHPNLRGGAAQAERAASRALSASRLSSNRVAEASSESRKSVSSARADSPCSSSPSMSKTFQ